MDCCTDTSWIRVVLIGELATVAMTALTSLAFTMGWTRLNMRYLLGMVITSRRDAALRIGSVMHLLFGALWSIGYAFVFRAWGPASWWRGAGLGLIHGVFVATTVLSMLPALHPRMASTTHGPTPTRQLEPPGLAGHHYGLATPWVVVAAHVAFGTLLGAYLGAAG